MDAALSGGQVWQCLGFIAAMICLLIALTRYFFAHYHNTIDQRDTFTLSERTKHRTKQVLTRRYWALGVGMICSLACAFVTISWTVWDEDLYVTACPIDWDEEENTIPVTFYKKPPPRPVVQSIPDAHEVDPLPEEVFEEDPVDYQEISDDVGDITDLIDSTISSPRPVVDTVSQSPPLPPLPEEDPEVEEIFDLVEQMPLWGGCTDKKCSDRAVLHFLHKHIRYPSIAKENDVQGKVIVEFVVDKTGQMHSLKILRGIGAGCDQEALKALMKMNDQHAWQAGQQQGRPVQVLYRVPITFALTK